MSEFQEVMKQWARMCNAVPGKSECISICSDKQSGYVCPMHRNGLCNKSLGSQTDYDRLEGEKIIMSWAAEHPMPEYPLWIDFLSTVGLIIQTNDCTTCAFDFTKAYTQIPADIAQKLGIEPKGNA